MRNVHATLALALWGSIAAGCDLGEMEPIAQPHLVVLDEGEAALVALAPDALHVAAGAVASLDALEVGDVVLSHGVEPFLRKVVAVHDERGVLAIATEPAALTDAVFDGEIHSSGDVFTRGAATGGGADELVIAVDRLALDLSNVKLVDQSDFKVQINRGSISFRPALDVDLKVAGGAISHFHAVLRGDLSASMGMSITAGRGASRSFSKTIWQSPAYRATQLVGAIPVVEVVRVSLVATGEAHTSASGTVELGSASARASLEAGATYDAGWRAVAKPSVTLDARGPVAKAAVTAGVSVRLSLRVDVKFYDVAGPHLSVGTYARADVGTSSASWAGRVGIDASFGGNVAVLGKTLASYNKKLFDQGRSFSTR